MQPVNLQYHACNLAATDTLDCSLCLSLLTDDPATDAVNPNNPPAIVAHNISPENTAEDWHKIHKYCLDQLISTLDAPGYINCPECRRKIDYTPLYPIDPDFPIIHVEEQGFNPVFENPLEFVVPPIIYIHNLEIVRAYLFASEWRESDEGFLESLRNFQ